MSSPSAAPLGVARLSMFNEDGTYANLVGFRFVPTAHDIVQHFLSKKVSGQEVPDSPIRELDVYRFEPEQLPITISNGRTRWMYFFVFMTEDNMDHSTPKGFWKLEEQDVRIEDELTHEVIGFKNSFSYYTNEPGHDGQFKTKWVMDEYRTHGVENPNNPLMKNWMLCKVQAPIPRVVVAKKVAKKRRERRGRGGGKRGGPNPSVTAGTPGLQSLGGEA